MKKAHVNVTGSRAHELVSYPHMNSECACEKVCVRMTYLSMHGSTHVQVSVVCIPWSGT